VSFSFLQAKLPLTITWGQCDPLPQTNTIIGSTRLELAPLQNLEECGWPQTHLFTSHTKTWGFWRVESTPTSASV